MLKLFRVLFRDPTRKDIIINTIGNNLNVIFTAVFALLLTRILTPAQYGVMSVLLGIAYVLANILDFGTSATIYSYLPPLLATRDRSIYKFVKSTFYYQTIFSIIIIITLSLSFPFLDEVFFHTGAPVSDMYLTSISVLLFIWQNFIWNCMAAAKRFAKANLYQNISNVIKTITILSVAHDQKVSISTVIFVFGILGPLVFFLFILLEKKNTLMKVLRSPVDKSELRIRYTMTYFVASQFFNLGLRMDLFLLSFFNMKIETGHYGLAQKVILTLITTVVSITQVLSPAMSSVTTKKDARDKLKMGLMYLSGPAILFALLNIIPDWIYGLIFTEKFAQSAPIAAALSIPFIIYTLGSLPMLFLLYTAKRPKYILYANILFFIVMTAGCYYLIPIYGVYGPPIAVGSAIALATIIVSVASWKEYKKLPER